MEDARNAELRPCHRHDTEILDSEAIYLHQVIEARTNRYSVVTALPTFSDPAKPSVAGGSSAPELPPPYYLSEQTSIATSSSSTSLSSTSYSSADLLVLDPTSFSTVIASTSSIPPSAGSTATDPDGLVTSSPSITQPPASPQGNGTGTMAGSHKTLTIVLSTTLPSVFLISVAAYICYRVQRRRTRLFKRGITPIEDEEIESWKVDRNEEKPIIMPETDADSRPTTQHHHPSNSITSIQKPPSVIVYQNQGLSRHSEDLPPHCLHHHKNSSLDMPQTPLLARAPNARPGLTDDTVRGDDAFLPQLKRQPSRLNKSQPASPRHNRTRSARSSMSREQWHGQGADGHQISPRRSAESFPRTPTHKSKHKRIFSSSNPPRMSLDDDSMSPGGLSPRPQIRKSEIGRAIG